MLRPANGTIAMRMRINRSAVAALGQRNVAV
jgi:hypothetical protein